MLCSCRRHKLLGLYVCEPSRPVKSLYKSAFIDYQQWLVLMDPLTCRLQGSGMKCIPASCPTSAAIVFNTHMTLNRNMQQNRTEDWETVIIHNVKNARFLTGLLSDDRDRLHANITHLLPVFQLSWLAVGDLYMSLSCYSFHSRKNGIYILLWIMGWWTKKVGTSLFFW